MAGGAYKDDDEGGAITDINVTPLVDVMLVLLVIFMVTARLIVARGIEVARPAAAAGQTQVDPILVTVDKDGALYVEGTLHADAASAIAALKARAATMPDPKVIIDGDQAGTYGSVYRAIDIVQAADIQRIALANKQLPAGAAPGGGP